ncbi:MAG TPA: GNAT family N-acetyltransferase [Actinomycetota bacterium]|nr:GNAT family N-acetyltransferase [Actinomycetota bacterium]
MSTPPIRLVPASMSHAAGMQDLISDPEVLRFTRIPSPPPDDFVETWLQRYEAGRADGTRAAFTIEDPGDGRFLGIAVAPSIRRDERTAELGYVVHPDARRRGIATVALERLTAWGFSELDAVRLELLISVDNKASKRVAEHNGYHYEGTMRSLFVAPGRWEDSEIWSRLVTDR